MGVLGPAAPRVQVSSAFAARSSRQVVQPHQPLTTGPACTARTQRARHVCHVVRTEDLTSEEAGFKVEKFMLGSGLIDFYALLGVDDDASPEEIKKAYRNLAKTCHPDFLGDEGHDICILLNEAYDTLSDANARGKYNAQLEQALKDDEDDYTGQPLSKWMPSLRPSMSKNEDPNEQRGVFVDEFTCIGCKQCVWHASATFRIEPEHGRSRVFAQWLDDEEHIQAAIDSCPVSCIHWVNTKQELAALEYVMQKRMTQRTPVGVMMAGQGVSLDVFDATRSFMKERRRRAEAQELASKARAYSPSQEAARKAATDALRKKQMGVMAGFGRLMDDFVQQMNSTVAGVPENMVTVGKRKRSVRWDMAAAAKQRGSSSPAPGGEDWFLVPPERALVPVSLKAADRL